MTDRQLRIFRHLLFGLDVPEPLPDRRAARKWVEEVIYYYDAALSELDRNARVVLETEGPNDFSPVILISTSHILSPVALPIQIRPLTIEAGEWKAFQDRPMSVAAAIAEAIAQKLVDHDDIDTRERA